MRKNIFSICIQLFFIIPFSKAQSIENGSFEVWGNPTSCDVNSTPDSWMNYSNGCFAADECNFLYCPTSIPPNAFDGNSYSRMCAVDSISGEGIFQIVDSIIPGTDYVINFSYSGSNLYSGSGNIQFVLFIDDLEISRTSLFSSSDPVWKSFSHSIIFNQSSAKIGIRLVSENSVHGSGAIDNISLNGISSFNDDNICYTPRMLLNELPKYIYLCNLKFANILVLDITGKIILNTDSQSISILDPSAFAKGIYIYIIQNKNSSIYKGILFNF